MGGVKRANMMSEKLGMSKAVKKFLKFILEKCGNCPFRIVCWSQLFPDKGKLIEEYRKVFLCEGKYDGNAKESFDGKQVVKIIQNCHNCIYIRHCINNILDADEFLGMIEATSGNSTDHAKVITKCALCEDNVRCWSGILKELEFGWAKSPMIVKIMLKCKFNKRERNIENGGI